MSMRKCPRCNKEYREFPALSRRDNQTDICSACGIEEAFIDAGFDVTSAARQRELMFMKMLEIKERKGKQQ